MTERNEMSGWQRAERCANKLLRCVEQRDAARAERDALHEALDRIRRLDHAEGDTLERARGIALDALAGEEEE